jgi:hypothetical protein
MASNRAIRAGRAFVELFTDNSKLTRGLKAARTHIKAFGGRIRAMGLKMVALSATILAPLAGAAKYFSSYGDQVAKMSKRTGLSVESLSALRFVASQTGTEFASLEMAFRKMQRSIYDAGRGLSTQKDALSDLGLAFEDLKDLSPEDQFKLLSDRLGKITDDTKQAALAQMLFGRTGTNLIPMFEAGAKGMSQLEEEARSLGLVMSKEDAAAAEEFTDKLDALWKVVQMGVFRVGSALAPVLEKAAEKIKSVSLSVSKWIDKNRWLIATVFKITVAVLAAGAALAILGTAIGLLSHILTGLLAIVAVGKIAFTAFAAVLAFLLTPLGWVTVAVGVLGAYIITATSAGAKALGWLGKRFNSLANDVQRAWKGIGDALASGDIGLAVEIAWLTIKKAWLDGTKGLREYWADLVSAMQVWWMQGSRFIARAWITLVTVLKKAWTGFSGWWKKAQEGLATSLTWVVAKVRGATDEEADAAFAHAGATHNARMKAIDDETAKSQKAHDAEFNTLDKRIDQNYEKEMASIGKSHQEKIAKIEAELKATKAKWEKAMAQAARQRDAGDGDDGGPGYLEDPKALLDKIKTLASDLKYDLSKGGGPGGATTGTFSGVMLGGLGAGYTSNQDRAAKAAEANLKRAMENARYNKLSADNLKRIERRFRSGPRFAR